MLKNTKQLVVFWRLEEKALVLCCLLVPDLSPRGISYLSFDDFRYQRGSDQARPSSLLKHNKPHVATAEQRPLDCAGRPNTVSQTGAGLPQRQVYCLMLLPWLFWGPLKAFSLTDFTSKKPGARLKSNREGLVFMTKTLAETKHSASAVRQALWWLQLHVRRRWVAAAGDPLRGGFKAWSPL